MNHIGPHNDKDLRMVTASPYEGTPPQPATKQRAITWMVLMVVVGIAVFFGYPLLSEGTSSDCDALERVAIRVAAPAGDAGLMTRLNHQLSQFVQRQSQGEIASAAAKNEYPNRPAAIGCSVLYWRSMLDPESFREFAQRATRLW